MGSSALAVNLDKREFLNPSNFDCDWSFRSQVGCGFAVSDALALLISVPLEPDPTNVVYGRWAGDRVVFVSDYGGYRPGNAAWEIFQDCVAGKYINIGEAARALLYAHFANANWAGGYYEPRARLITDKIVREHRRRYPV
jgi:hypothetical protein